VPVVIRYDPKDRGEIRVYQQNRFLCRAICQELADRTIGLKELVRARTQSGDAAAIAVGWTWLSCGGPAGRGATL
jgi:hypothetical protein